jgi:hypothetical protein
VCIPQLGELGWRMAMNAGGCDIVEISADKKDEYDAKNP